MFLEDQWLSAGHGSNTWTNTWNRPTGNNNHGLAQANLAHQDNIKSIGDQMITIDFTKDQYERLISLVQQDGVGTITSTPLTNTNDAMGTTFMA